MENVLPNIFGGVIGRGVNLWFSEKIFSTSCQQQLRNNVNSSSWNSNPDRKGILEKIQNRPCHQTDNRKHQDLEHSEKITCHHHHPQMTQEEGPLEMQFILWKLCKRKWLARKQVTLHKMKFSIKDFFSICDQIQRKLRIWSHLLKKSLMENFIFCAA